MIIRLSGNASSEVDTKELSCSSKTLRGCCVNHIKYYTKVKQQLLNDTINYDQQYMTPLEQLVLRLTRTNKISGFSLSSTRNSAVRMHKHDA